MSHPFAIQNVRFEHKKKKGDTPFTFFVREIITKSIKDLKMERNEFETLKEKQTQDPKELKELYEQQHKMTQIRV